MKIKCVLVDDEPLAIKVLQNYFINFPEFEIVGVFYNSLEALDYIKNNTVDVAFLDINMPIMSGFDLIRLIDTKVVITTAFREFAAESYDLDVVDYLVKPIPLSRFIKSIGKITAELDIKNGIKSESSKLDHHIFIKSDKKMIKILMEEILFIEGMKEYIKVVTADKSYITLKSLSSLSDELPMDKFIRIHKSFIIAIDKIKSIEGNRIQILTHKLPIGRNYGKDVKNKILNN
ncbi:DNA-binding response regulator [Flavobacterium sp. 9AF]|uniref:LytR/AlgR family response regulator transcription factor n=1 Tax=Flavobacterium sp. 9AF TaxID=2653142 RepID=UPI0012F0E2EB|nr:LytTR family DNA-binding domain-containing protein [Flavobacterium sp. 9AF]VXB98743.1 DNA-binding response regulator [Flavobacterium sp. 9AF]